MDEAEHEFVSLIKKISPEKFQANFKMSKAIHAPNIKARNEKDHFSKPEEKFQPVTTNNMTY
jgi:hypothetical protein